jgi:hypothetical protein
MTGFLFWGALIAFFGVIGIQLVPLYAEYYEVKKTMEKAVQEYDGNNAQKVRSNYDLYASAGYAEGVKGKEMEFAREDGQLIMSVAWQRKRHLVGNISLLLDFEVSVHK